MCKKWFKEHFEEIPSWVMNIILIGAIFCILVLRFFNKFLGNDTQLLQILAILFGTLVVGNSITNLRSKTVQNELIRSNIDIINYCITNKKLIIETYNAANSKNLDNTQTDNAKKEADNALQCYNEYCKELRKICDGDIVDKAFKKALGELKK